VLEAPPGPPFAPTATTLNVPTPPGTLNVSSPAVVYVHEFIVPDVEKTPVAPHGACACAPAADTSDHSTAHVRSTAGRRAPRNVPIVKNPRRPRIP
jgi:hypothetical protein